MAADGTSSNGGTGNRWWYERARCGDAMSVSPHTWQLLGSSPARACGRRWWPWRGPAAARRCSAAWRRWHGPPRHGFRG
eukprot:296803-Chlamydomonas_euryale.AAC.1